MRRVFDRRQDALEVEIEDNKWRRKSYALAQHNSVPVPMPLPAYPPPKVIPMPTSAPSRRTRPYRPPPASYRSAPPTHPPPDPPTDSPPDLLMHPVPALPARNPPELPTRPLPEVPTRPPPPAAPPRRRHSPVPVSLPVSSSQIVPVLPPLEEEDLLGPLPPSPPDASPSPPPSSTSTSLSHFPATPTPQTLSDTQSDTPSSLTCPRTPTSIRAAPWQPPTPLPSTTTSLSSTPTPRPVRPTSLATTPSPLPSPPASPPLGDPTEYPPTPTSTHTDDGVSPLKTSAVDADVEDNQDDEPDKAPRYQRQSSPLATLDVTQLKADLRLVGLGNGIAQPTSPTDTTTPSVTSFDITRPPLEGPVKMAVFEGGYRAYRTRFWILGVFSMLAFLQSMVWGTWAPIVDSAQLAFGWSDAMVAAFPNWGPVVVVTFTIPMMWITQKMGLRLGVVACAALICGGTFVRCFTSQPELFTVLCHVGAVLNSFAACMTLSLPAMVAAVWFPPGERITATAVGALMCQLGGAAMYMGPLVVRSPNVQPTLPPIFLNAYPTTLYPTLGRTTRYPFYRRTTTPPYNLWYPTTTPSITPFTPTTTVVPLTPEDIRGDIMHLMYIHFGLAALMLVAAASYFPARPPSPPSATSAQDKPDFLSGLKSIVSNVQMLLVLGVYSFSFGVPVVWIGVLTLSLRLVDLDQNEAMGVAVVAVVVSSTAAFLTAFVTDKMYGHLRNTIIALLVGSTACFVWFLLLSTRTIEPSLAQVYVCVTGAMSLEFASVPLLVELAVELGYPIPESVTGAALTLLFNVVALIFLGLFQVPSDYLWVSYVLVACVSLSIVPLLFVKETHKRSQADRKS